MNSNKWIRAAFFVAGYFYAGLGNAMVGTISVGLGQMDQDIGQLQTSFAADAVLETEDMTVNTRVHYQPGMVRDEMNVGGQEMITIRRFDLDKVWTIMGQGMYMETAADEANDEQGHSGTSGGRRVVREMEQLPLFTEYLPHPAVELLRSVDLHALTPLAAFDLLRKLKQELDNPGETTDAED